MRKPSKDGGNIPQEKETQTRNEIVITADTQFGDRIKSNK